MLRVGNETTNLRIEVPHMQISLDIKVDVNINLSKVVDAIIDSTEKNVSEELQKVKKKMNLRCSSRQNNTWLDHNNKLKIYESVFCEF